MIWPNGSQEGEEVRDDLYPLRFVVDVAISDGHIAKHAEEWPADPPLWFDTRYDLWLGHPGRWVHRGAGLPDPAAAYDPFDFLKRGVVMPAVSQWCHLYRYEYDHLSWRYESKQEGPSAARGDEDERPGITIAGRASGLAHLWGCLIPPP